MKKIFILSLLCVGLAGCETANRTPYTGSMGEYGFTYDLESSPSPFVDTSYRPLTPFDLAAPIIVVVTNQPPPRIVYQQAPTIGETVYAGETPTRGSVVTAAPTTIVEAAGAQRGQPGAGYGATPATAGGYAPGYYSAGGDAAIFPGTNVIQTNTNLVVTNITSTNTNVFGLVTNTNAFGTITNTNAFAGGTNREINEPAGTQLQTNRSFGEPPTATQFRTNRFGEPASPPRQTSPNPVVVIPPPAAQPQPQQPPPVQTPVQRPEFRTPPPQRPVAEPPPVQTPQQQRTGPPASAPASPPAPLPANP